MLSLLVGGAGSGKSELAERRTMSLAPPVTYVATWVPAPGAPPDPDMDERIRCHRARRPAEWGLVETHDLPAALEAARGTVLVDALGTWVASCPDFDAPTRELCAALAARRGDTVVVSDEVGLGVHPSTAVGGRFRVSLAAVNLAVAAIADEAWLVVSGRVLPLSKAVF